MNRITMSELIMHCSVASGPEAEHVNDTLYRVIQATSQGQVASVIDATTGLTHVRETMAAAASHAEALEEQGHDVRIGLAGIPIRVMREMGRSTLEGLDPCVHVSIASMRLESVLTTRSRRDVSVLHVELTRYWSPSDSKGAQAIEWGARVVALERPDVSTLYSATLDGESVEPRIYAYEASVFLRGGLPAATKWEALR